MTWARELLRWYRAEGRILPWRSTRDPYRILVSEVMLQQTQVSRVLEYYHTWLKLFPTFKALAQAHTSNVLHAWAGLGYNRRALALKHIAQHITTHGIPATRDEWLKLKGIGPYTADAIACFSLYERRWPIDTNLRRVGGRVWLGIPFPQLSDDERIRNISQQELRRKKDVHLLPQAAFDLATMLCTKTPQCAQCPLKRYCKASSAFLAGTVATPKRMTKATKERIHTGKRFPDRIYRGRILALVRKHSTQDPKTIGPLIDSTFRKAQDTPWLNQMIQRLIKDGLIMQNEKGALHLPS